MIVWAKNGYDVYNCHNVSKEEVLEYVRFQAFPKMEKDYLEIDGNIRFEIIFRSPSDDADRVLKELQKLADKSVFWLSNDKDKKTLCVVCKKQYRNSILKSEVKNVASFMKKHSNVEEKVIGGEDCYEFDEWSYAIITKEMKRKIEEFCTDEYPKLLEAKRKRLLEDIERAKMQMEKIDKAKVTLVEMAENL